MFSPRRIVVSLLAAAFVAAALLLGLAPQASAQLPSSSASTRNYAPPEPARADYVDVVGQVGGSLSELVVQDNYAYVGLGRRLAVLDVSTSSSPTLVGQSLPLSHLVRDVAVAGDYAYVMEASITDTEGEQHAGGGLHVLDVSNPVSPTLVGAYEPPDVTHSIEVSGNYVYLVGESLHVIDVSDPTTPTEVGSLAQGGANAAVAGRYLYIATLDRVRIVDVSNPSAPQEVGFYTLPQVKGSYARIVDVSAAGEYVYVITNVTSGNGFAGGHLHIVDASTPSAPEELDSVAAGLSNRLAIAGGYAYVTRPRPSEGIGELLVFRVDPANDAVHVASHPVQGEPLEVAVEGNRAYLTMFGTPPSGNAWTNGLQVVDVSTPSSPTGMGQYDTFQLALSVAAAGNYAYVGGPATFNVVEVDNPASPEEVGSVNTVAEDVVVSDTVAYLAAGDDGLRILNVSNPTTPTQLSLTDMPEYAFRLTVAGNYAYVAQGNLTASIQGSPTGLQIFDVSNPSSPTALGFYDPPEHPDGPTNPSYVMDVAVAGNYAYVAHSGASTSGLRVLDVTNPMAPTEVGFYPTGDVRAVAVEGGYVYLAELGVYSEPLGRYVGGGLHIVDVSDPTSPTRAGFFSVPGRAVDVAVDEDYLYLSADYIANGVSYDPALLILNVATPGVPDMIGLYDAHAGLDIATDGETIYLADERDGLTLLRYTGTGESLFPLHVHLPLLLENRAASTEELR